jgi:putative membrane protein
MLDLWLAVLHHVIVFALFGIVFSEFIMVRAGMDLASVRRVGRIDAWYGILAAAILIVGFVRATQAAKGWAYYEANLYFWCKIGTFALIGILSIPPTLDFRKWRKSESPPSDSEIARARSFLTLEVLLFAPLLLFAAAMARGYGMPSTG